MAIGKFNQKKKKKPVALSYLIVTYRNLTKQANFLIKYFSDLLLKIGLVSALKQSTRRRVGATQLSVVLLVGASMRVIMNTELTITK